ncbi:MAG TPA: NAD(P)-binding protein [Dongiaceae bacterium]|nr:NAD(P)-binding protein [Dongiaceae bacterium]
MDTTEQFDAIIVGGGPAGLAIASELSSRFRVLVLEKGTAGSTDRFWFVPPDVLDDKTRPFSYGGVTRFLTKTYSMHGDDLAWRARLFASYPYIRDHEILAHWLEVIRGNGSVVLGNCSYLEHDTDAGGVSVGTDRGPFRGRLLIDCSGYDSSIVEKYGIDRSDFYWWSVYGAIGTHPDGLGELQVGDYMMWQTFADADPGSLADGKPVFEYEILDGKSSFSLILYLRKVRMDREAMKAEYYRILRDEDSTRDFHDLQVTSERWGWYPSGGVSQQIAAERVAFAGDAACWTTPCGWGMTFILDNYRFFSSKIADCLAGNTLDRESLLGASNFRLNDKYEITTNVIATHFLANASTPELDRFIRLFMNDLDPILCEKIFTLKIGQEELLEMVKAALKEFSMDELCRLVPAVGLTNLLNEVRYFAGDALLDTLKELFHAHPDTDGGFDFDDREPCPVIETVS